MEFPEKYSMTPLFVELGDMPNRLPVHLEDLSVEVASLRPKDFSLWTQYVSDYTLQFFETTNVALIHRFKSPYGMGKQDEDSKDLLRTAFACLRLVKPTSTPFSVIQFRKTEQPSGDDQYSFSPPDKKVYLPRSEVFNRITISDLEELRRSWPPYRKLRTLGPGHLRRATRYYETGYELKDGDIQFTTWVAGIEALYANGEEPCSADVIKARIFQAIGPETDIYRDLEYSFYRPTSTSVKKVIDDIFELRNRFAHGAWAPPPWLQEGSSSAIGAPVAWAEVLRDAANFILRTGLRNTLSARP